MKALINLTNEDRGYRFAEYDDDIPEGMTRGEIFRAYQREYGRCKSAVYVDTPAGAQAVGWYFEKRERFIDCPTSFIQGAWVELSDVDEYIASLA